MYSDLFGEYDKLLRVRVLEKEIEVPEKNTLLRGFQFNSPHTISYGQFCWNGTCHNCIVTVREACGESKKHACRLNVCDGLQVVGVSSEIKRHLYW
jgi:hypothetical protein